MIFFLPRMHEFILYDVINNYNLLVCGADAQPLKVAYSEY